MDTNKEKEALQSDASTKEVLDAIQTDATDEIESLKSTIKELEEENASIKEGAANVEMLNTKVTTLESTINEQNDRLEDLEKENKQLKKELDSVSTTGTKRAQYKSAETPTVKIDGKKMKFKYPSFNFNGNDISAEEVKKDASLIKQLYEANPGLFIPA